jgi:hypothetical protein
MWLFAFIFFFSAAQRNIQKRRTVELRIDIFSIVQHVIFTVWGPVDSVDASAVSDSGGKKIIKSDPCIEKTGFCVILAEPVIE